MRRTGILLLILAIGGIVALAQTASPDDAAIRELVAKYASARESEDAASIEKLFTEDADQLVSSGEWRHGRASLVKGMLASSRGNPGDRTITVETLRFVAPGVALADARYEIAASAGREARKMWSTFLAVRGAEGWRIAAIRNMLPAR
ncbi:MAG: SgcJ/EcaC family oxidoreductase [Bryobacterales bacterium]|nr:SgcJ/EcaC family oxidoreductase [Bryobacterales bacterium]